MSPKASGTTFCGFFRTKEVFAASMERTDLLRPGERLDDLLTHDIRIIQSDEVFSFSLDAVLLARFCSVPPRGRIVDLCTGNGVIPLLLTTRTRADIVGVEIQERLADMAARNVQLNGLGGQIRMLHADLKTVHGELGHGQFDLVTVNPPYLPVRSGDRKANPHIAAARHEVYCTLDDVAAACSRLVRPGGKVAMVHRPSRLAEIICALREHRLEPKRMRFIHPRAGEEANMVLIEAAKDGKPEVRLLPPLIVHEGDGYCKELLDVYYGRADRLEDAGSGDSEELRKQDQAGRAAESGGTDEREE
jgi:tRNA1(Val) A37 N6-methylase TrmN6